ncbi:MAG: hypothetical protein MUF15_04125, partial [Acidobacteria bacterium]|nr:hypothetical protein [Acidobacteriota bacterium]
MKSVLIILLCLTLTSSLKSQDKNEWWENINVLNKYMQKNIDYPKVDADFPTIERKEEFLKYFLTLMDKLADNNDDLSFLKLVNFWDNHFKHDSIFREIRNIETKLSIEGVFTSFKAEINQRKQDKWKNLEKLNADEIELFEQIDKTGVSEYMKAWNEISTNIVPQNSDAFKVLTDKYDIISRIASLNQDINRTVANYINCWRQYFEVKSRSDYAGKENASREKIKALNCAMDIGGNNNFFDINSSLENLNTRISYFEDDENKWKAHRLVDTIISEFEVNTTHTLADIYTTRDAVLNAAGNTTLETELANKLQKFKDIPETITIENLEDYLTSRWNNNDNVVTILKNELKSKLEIQVGNLLKNGKRGNFARSINEVVVLENRYFDLFKGNTRWLNCINMLRGYYNEKENKNYSFVLGCYNDTACTSEISKVWFWDKAEIKDQFWSYFLNQAKIILQNERNIKTQQDFSQFKETLYIPIENIFGVEEPLKSRYSALNNYFSSKTSNETEKAARNLYTNFPKLAAAYSIKDPDEKIKLEWNAKLIDFKNDYRNVLQAIRATNLTDQDKKQKLLTITNKFVEDNPYSSEDDQMREQLKQKLANVNNKIEENKRRVEKINQDFANQLNDLNVFLNALNSNEEKKNKIEKFQSTYENNIADLTENNKNKLVQIRNTLNDINKSIEERIKLNKDFNEQLKNLNDSIKNSTSDEAKKSAIEGLLGRYKKNLELFTESNQEKFNGLEKTLNAIKESNENRQKINNEFIKKINVLEPILNSQTASDDQVKKLTDFYNEYKGEDNLFPDNKNKLTNFKNNMDSLTNKIQQAKNAIADQQKDFDQNYDSIMKLDINQEGPEAIQQV